MPEQFRVVPLALNLRRTPGVSTVNRIAVLPEGTIVDKLGDAGDGWWRVRTTLNGVAVEGFVSARYLARVLATDPTPTITVAVGPVHLEEGRRDITRAGTSGRAYPLGEPGRPPAPSGVGAGRRDGLLAIIDWLDVEAGARWRPGGGATFCNIYAYDVCYLAGAFLPRVWWKPAALARLMAGEPVVPRYDVTVQELNANALADWFEDHGARFGWSRTFDLGVLQNAANEGRLAVIVAQRTNLNRSGHIQIVAPEHGDQQALRRADGTVALPLQSQAGTRNFRYGFLGRSAWWANPTQYRKHGFWTHQP